MLSTKLTAPLPEYFVSVAFLLISLGVHAAVFTGSIHNGYNPERILAAFLTFPITAFTIYFTIRAFVTDSLKTIFSQDIFSGKYVIFIFQLFLLILLFDSYKEVIALNPMLFMLSIFVSDAISYFLTKILTSLNEWHLTIAHQDQFFFLSLKVFIWYIILPAIYLFSVVFIHH